MWPENRTQNADFLTSYTIKSKLVLTVTVGLLVALQVTIQQLNCVQEEHKLTLFYDRDITPMTLKLEDDLDIRKMYLHTENEAACLRHSKHRA